MSNQDEPDELTYWTSVIAKALAYLSLHQADLRKADIVTQANFLLGLGLSQADAAAIIGTTAATVQVSLSKAKSKRVTKTGKGGRRGQK